MSKVKVTLLLGSNIPDQGLYIEQALVLIENRIGEIQKRSGKIWNPPIEFESRLIFCNIAVEIFTNLSPMKLLHAVKVIEEKMGRQEDSFAVGGYQDRVIDIDIINYDNLSFFSHKLIIPHHRNLFERSFSRKILINFK